MGAVATIAVLAACVLLVAAWWDLRLPRTVRWRPGDHDGMRVGIASGLVLQHDDGTTVWATRGYGIYRSDDGAAFRRVARIRPPRGEALGGLSRTLRRRYGYQELVEVLPLDEAGKQLVAFAAGWIHRLDLDAGTARRVQQLRYFGRGKGRGLMAFGIDRAADGAIYFAEYVTESGERPTGVWRSDDAGETWTLAYEFDANAIRHIHAVQHDPHDDAIWIGTGDRDEHCFVGVSRDGARTFDWVGHGQQVHRACAFAFFPDVVVWATDADFEQNHVVRWHRSTGAVTVDATLPDVTYYASRVDDERVLLGLAQGVAEVWIADRAGAARRWVGWPVAPTPPARGPSPGARLARGKNRTGRHVHVSPLRTIGCEAAVYRFDREALAA